MNDAPGRAPAPEPEIIPLASDAAEDRIPAIRALLSEVAAGPRAGYCVVAHMSEAASKLAAAAEGHLGWLVWECERLRAALDSRSGGAPPAARPAEPPTPNPLDVLALARIAAKRHHYALTVHGSLARDLDLVAVPWKECASEPAVLVEAIRAAVGGWIMVADDSPNKGRDGYFTIDDSSKHSPSERAHGRLAWSIYGVLGGAYLDLSVMPLRAAPPPSEAPRGTEEEQDAT